MMFTVVFAKQAISKKPEKENNTGFSGMVFVLLFFFPFAILFVYSLGFFSNALGHTAVLKNKGYP